VSTSTVQPGRLTLGCADLDALPLFGRADSDGRRDGYEPAVAETLAERLGLELAWTFLAWSDFYPSLDDRRVDGILCGQGITDARRRLADFTAPYAVFDESLVVRADNPASSPEALAGLRIGAIEGSTNMRLAETFPGVRLVSFPGTEDVFGDMIRALREGTVDGFVDDDVVMVPLGEEPDLRLAFTVPTRNRWGIAVRRENDAVRLALDEALAAAVTDGTLADRWERWLPWLSFPF
jgi:ABC-type amino acid transport substrate-binding protein